MRYISVFSGIEAASVAWEPLGWEPVAFSEVDDFPSAVLAERFPDVPNLGDITKVDWSEYSGAVELVVGGSPCQSFSIAGSRTGLEGASGLMWEYVRCVREVRPRWFLWENVPGALSSAKGEDFACLLRSMDELGYGLAWRVLDAQFFGVAQRRRRVFLVGSLGYRRAADVLFEPESLRWDHPSSRAKREALTGRAEKSAGKCYQIAGNIINRQPQHGGHQLGVRDPKIDGAFTLTAADRHAVATPKTMLVRCGCAGGGKGALIQDDVSSTLSTSNTQTLFQPIAMAANQRGEVRLDGGDGETVGALPASRSGKQVQAIVMADDNVNSAIDEGMCGTLKVGCRGPIVCMTDTQPHTSVEEGVCGTLSAHTYKDPPVVSGPDYVVRKLTPLECERLQGFPDGWTDVEFKGKKAPDSRRYKALGNSMAVPVIRWIGERIEAVDRL